MRTSFRYFVCYYFCDKNGQSGLGNGMVECNDEVNDFIGVQELIKRICDNNNYKDVAIINWKLLK